MAERRESPKVTRPRRWLAGAAISPPGAIFSFFPNQGEPQVRLQDNVLETFTLGSCADQLSARSFRANGSSDPWQGGGWMSFAAFPPSRNSRSVPAASTLRIPYEKIHVRGQCPPD